MPETTRVDFHCHSTWSDGTEEPAALARLCAEAGVQYAALTDHDSLEGQRAFASACEALGMGFVSGVELTVRHEARELHLLCLGFDETDAAMVAAATTAGEERRLSGSRYSLVIRSGVAEYVDIVHRAGGVVLLAHPLLAEPRLEGLEPLLDALLGLGLDGIEAYHPSADPSQVEALRDLARRKGCIVSAGSDHHGEGSPEPGRDLPAAEWAAFRDRLFQRRRSLREGPRKADLASRRALGVESLSGRTRILLWMILPAVAAVGLFTIAIFGLLIPRFEDALMDRKRETIRELTNAVWSMLDEADREVRAGLLPMETARDQIVERVRTLRYGKEGKDYFWIQDLYPRMVMHPYRRELEGQDLSAFTDPRGVAIFSVFADKVRADREGYVDYVWQWMDDPERLEAKESYIRLFEPWGWVLGTGLYIHDVAGELHALRARLGGAMAIIAVVLVLLLLLMLRGGLRAERLRASAERGLRESNERYLSLVRAADEGVLFMRGRRCVYANPVFLELAGIDAAELPFLGWSDIFPGLSGWDPLAGIGAESSGAGALLRRRDGGEVGCRLSIKGASEASPGGYVVLVRPSAGGPADQAPPADGLLRRLLNLPAAAAEDIAREIGFAGKPEEVIRLCERSPALVQTMLESGFSAVAIAGTVSSITDAATRRFVEIAQTELGPPPVPFAFLALGSQGRREQTLHTDQDNAIVYEDGPEGGEASAKDYFAGLAGRVCGYLARSGYFDCKGLVMANNPAWCRSLADWKGYLKDWIGRTEERDMMEFGTFFDARNVAGTADLLPALRSQVRESIAGNPRFMVQAARNALQFKSPLRLFGALVPTGGGKERSGQLDLKAMTMPIVSFARLYALDKGLEGGSTAERLAALSDRGVILPSKARDIAAAFDALLRLRLREQSAAVQKGVGPDNLVDPSWLGHIDEAVLRECVKEVERLQDRIRLDFFGGEATG